VCPAGLVERHTKKATALNGEISSRSEPKFQERPPFQIAPNRGAGRRFGSLRRRQSCPCLDTATLRTVLD
jgi:hypothetical protein